MPSEALLTTTRRGRRRSLGWLSLAVGLTAACAATPPLATSEVVLPAGDGRAILEGQCLVCHELGAIELFEDFYNRDRWRALVVTMRENGAVLNDAEVDVLADYLATHFGTGT